MVVASFYNIITHIEINPQRIDRVICSSNAYINTYWKILPILETKTKTYCKHSHENRFICFPHTGQILQVQNQPYSEV